jgi:hypothetical protein
MLRGEERPITRLKVVFRREGVQAAVPKGFETLCAEFPTVGVGEGSGAGCPFTSLSLQEWETPSFNFYRFDARMDELAEHAGGGPFALRITGEPGRLPGAALGVLTRCQRLVGRRNERSRGTLFDRVLAKHRALHDLEKPLVRADYAHALDVWQWTLRLAPMAGLSVQLAALFHDIERLISEADARVEHKAGDYQAFKDAHAQRGAEMADETLAKAGIDEPTRRRAGRLIAGHEHPPESGHPDAADLALLNDADALSFFSLNSPGYMDYFGPEATRRKVSYTLARLRPAARRCLRQVRLRSDVAAIVAEQEAP